MTTPIPLTKPDERATRADIEHVLRNRATCAATVTRDVLVTWMRAQGWTLTRTIDLRNLNPEGADTRVELWSIDVDETDYERGVACDPTSWGDWSDRVLDVMEVTRGRGDRTWWLDLADLWVASGGRR